MSDFKKLSVWIKAHQLTVKTYQATMTFPKEEMYGLTSQIRRAASSIPTNIAEGSGRGGDREFIRFLRISRGSAIELEYHLMLVHTLGLMDNNSYQQLQREVLEVQRMLSGLIAKIKSRVKDD